MGQGRTRTGHPRWTTDEATFLEELGVQAADRGRVGDVLLERLAAAAPAPDPLAVERLRQRVAGAVTAESTEPGAGARSRLRSRSRSAPRVFPSYRSTPLFRPRSWKVAAAALVAAGLLAWMHPAVVQAALERIALWLPGAGFVLRDGTGERVRALKDPVTVAVAVPGWGAGRLTVEAVTALPELTEVRMRLEGAAVAGAADTRKTSATSAGAAGAGGPVTTDGAPGAEWPDALVQGWTLRLPDGTALNSQVVEWGPGSPLNVWFPPLPDGVDRVELVHQAAPAPGVPPGSSAVTAKIALNLVSAALVGVAAVEPDAWSPARSGWELGVPHLVVREDEVLLGLDVRPAPDATGGVPGAGQGSGQGTREGDGGGTGTPSWHLLRADDLHLTGPLGARLALEEAGTAHGRVDAPTFGLVARFRGVVPAWARSLELKASRLYVLEPGAGELRIPLAPGGLARGTRRAVDRRVEVGRWTVTVREVERVDASAVSLHLDLGAAQGGALLRGLSVQAAVVPDQAMDDAAGTGAVGGRGASGPGRPGEAFGEGRVASTVGMIHDPVTDRLQRVDLIFPAPVPRDGVLVVRFSSPSVVLEGPWTVQIPLR
ncbi:hypothetical protein [Thermaerobacter sp. PB12/4term]|uniref:hypothetical protein n=1 Tax=Thermaerobacter sp. PB12/4term TaxID=2293838 RepID=UPI000E326C1B|nr:hypothetical protein [Thermaerobacter sp. PB12/4term]